MGALATLLWLANVVLDTGGQLAFKAAASDPQDGEGLQRFFSHLRGEAHGRPARLWLSRLQTGA
ncbi:hypothetical protein D7U92_05245, partial [Stenotrophomonas maltophilia]|nr:hypothetical protein [Stenotrophomonas maltophilia]